ncbi:M20/M25/M40 family metallo-hydrolase [Phenylobacterium sp.]|uniref:M20/M25/M40 family metallo-hydrolase n=1 Tax=Phenylobacterium sp. TaxID=1871053 RepID=UPI00261521A9|nr:M20/M25/M40 family metallo-hydrolase [Phenylobacterium sp.]
MKRSAGWALGPLLGAMLAALAWPAAARSSAEVDAALRRAEAAHSEILPSAHVLADLYGPRLTGSRNTRAAARWVERTLAAWGLRDVHLEAWDFGHPGWTNARADAEITTPVRARLLAVPTAWTAGTRVAGKPVVIDPPRRTTRKALAAYLASVRPRLRGRIVMVGKGEPTGVDADPVPYRLDDKFLAQVYDPARASAAGQPSDSKVLTRSQWNRQLDAFLVAAGARLRVDDAHLPQGLIAARYNDTFEIRRAPPGVTLRNEDYGRIVRLLADGRSVSVAFDIRNRLDPRGRTAYDVVAEIPGGDRADEVVMVGAHLDSWHLATGATDDGAGCAIVMEAVRLLTELGIRPRRTIRLALWTGEEQGLFGSQAYVARHFGDAEHPGAEFGKLDAYVNLDGGAGRIRGGNVFGPPADGEVLHEALQPFSDLGVVGAVAHGMRRLGSTDATTFSRAGLPGIGLLQDPLENGVAEHTQLDTYERIYEPDARQAAVVVAGLIYDLAMRDAPLGRFPPEAMPAPLGPPPSRHPARDRGPGG